MKQKAKTPISLEHVPDDVLAEEHARRERKRKLEADRAHNLDCDAKERISRLIQKNRKRLAEMMQHEIPFRAEPCDDLHPINGFDRYGNPQEYLESRMCPRCMMLTMDDTSIDPEYFELKVEWNKFTRREIPDGDKDKDAVRVPRRQIKI